MKRVKVMVVDDDDNLAFLLRQRLEKEDFDVASASSAAEGYLIYLAFRPDLVVTDIVMGEENGLDLIKRIRNHDPKVGTIYMTADQGPYQSELERERKVNHVCVLEKPFGGDKLLASIAAQVHGGSEFAH
jgi:DNA-binding response OmpR family regulator